MENTYSLKTSKSTNIFDNADGVFNGRAGSYRYLVDIDDCIEQAFELKNLILKHKGIRRHRSIRDLANINDINQIKGQ